MPNSLLEKIFKKRKIKDFADLDDTPNTDGSPTERQVFEEWDRILSLNDEMTVLDLKKFLKVECDKIEMKWRSLDIENAKKAEWITPHTVYKTILLAIDSPKSARETLEKQLIELGK